MLRADRLPGATGIRRGRGGGTGSGRSPPEGRDAGTASGFRRTVNGVIIRLQGMLRRGIGPAAAVP